MLRRTPTHDALARLANDERSELAWVSLEELKRLEPAFFEEVAAIEAAPRAGANAVCGTRRKIAWFAESGRSACSFL